MTAGPALSLVDFGGDSSSPLLVLGPSLGTSVLTLWTPAAQLLLDRYRIIGWDLPGHGAGAPAAGFSIATLADAVVHAVATRCGDTRFDYAGDSIGGAVGLQLALDAPNRVRSVTALCTAALIGNPEAWNQRAATVREQGTIALLDVMSRRWFGSAFGVDEPARAALLDDLAAADDESYAATCEALSAFDLRAQLPAISAPVTAVAGTADVAIELESVREVATRVQDGRLLVLDGVGHLAPVEAPADTAVAIASAAGAR